MRTVLSLSAVVFATLLTVAGFGSGTALAAPCCSAPICQSEDPPRICDWCSPSCAADEAAIEADPYEDEVCALADAE
jgi:hypothetical protein